MAKVTEAIKQNDKGKNASRMRQTVFTLDAKDGQHAKAKMQKGKTARVTW